jgi:hypothetical protein
MNIMFKKVVCLCLAINILFLTTGCAGRVARPVQVNQIGDYNKDCNQLKNEINSIQYQVNATQVKDKTGSNTVLFLVGLVVFWPALFFMDLGNADQVERNALSQRQNHLNQLYMGKDCN